MWLSPLKKSSVLGNCLRILLRILLASCACVFIFQTLLVYSTVSAGLGFSQYLGSLLWVAFLPFPWDWMFPSMRSLTKATFPKPKCHRVAHSSVDTICQSLNIKWIKLPRTWCSKARMYCLHQRFASWNCFSTGLTGPWTSTRVQLLGFLQLEPLPRHHLFSYEIGACVAKTEQVCLRHSVWESRERDWGWDLWSVEKY